MSPLMQLLVDCENQLGWVPEGRTSALRARNRAVMHKVMTAAMTKFDYDVDDLRLAAAFCRRRRQAITSPLQLLPIVLLARELGSTATVGVLDTERERAICWELAHTDDDSPRWISRLNRAVADGLADALAEWAQLGRG